MKLIPKQTAMLTLDFQEAILAMAAGTEVAVANAAKAVELARKQGLLLIHVGLGFSEGHPEIAEGTLFAERIKANKLFVKESPSARFHPALCRPTDLVVYKHRVSAFSENELHLILRSHRIENLVLFGVATSGIVLSTLRHAFDLDYRSVVLKDACFDRDDEVHRVLTEKIFPGQATVLTVEDFITEQSAR